MMRPDSSLVRAASLAALSLALAVPAQAQTRFTWPAQNADLASYKSLEQCLAATDRMRDSVHSARSLITLEDTLPAVEGLARQPLPPTVVSAAARCAQRIDPATVALEDWDLAARLLLEAERLADARAVINRKLESVRTGTREVRVATIDQASTLYVDARPIAIEDAEALLDERDRITPEPIFRLGPRSRLFTAAREAGDTARMRSMYVSMKTFVETMTPEERTKAGYDRILQAMAFTAKRWLARQALLDSLGRGTKVYADAVMEIWKSSGPHTLSVTDFPAGQVAPELKGAFWYRRDAAGAPRPRKGRLSIVVSFDAASCFAVDRLTEGQGCYERAATVRRLAERYPELEVTVVSRTMDRFVDVAMIDRPAEAEWVRRWLHDKHRLPGTLIVDTTSFFTLDDPDGRRIGGQSPNVVAYQFGGRGSDIHVLVDEDGLVVHNGIFNRNGEREFIELIDVLQARLRRAGGAQVDTQGEATAGLP